MNKVAVLGGTVSGLVASRRLIAAGRQVDHFAMLLDPARSIHTPHALCEYTSDTFVLAKDAPAEFTAEVREWVRSGAVTEATREFTLLRYDAARRRSIQTRLPKGCRRYRPVGGSLALIDDQLRSLPGLNLQSVQLTSMERDDNGAWWLRDLTQQRALGPYDAVALAFDQRPRGARKASFKALLETALPVSSRVIASAAHAQYASSMAVVVSFPTSVDLGCDAIIVDGVPELRFASRNARDQQHGRGLKTKSDTWTLVSTPEWSCKQRPKHKGRWNKKKVGDAIVSAFGRVMKRDVGSARMVLPTFHWTGCSGITQVDAGTAPCAWDAEARLGWCGDIFGGQGMAGACRSGVALADAIVAQSPVSCLPLGDSWALREPSPGDEDTSTIVGPCTGRHEPMDGLDHTWPTAVKLAKGAHLASADSYAKYRSHGVMHKDRKRLAVSGHHR